MNYLLFMEGDALSVVTMVAVIFILFKLLEEAGLVKI